MRDKKELEGLEATTLAVAAQKAAEEGHKGATAEAGPWLLTLDYTTYSAVVSFANNRDMREKVYKAYRSIGAQGKTDNTDIIRQIIAKRQQLARMLGFKNYAEESFLGKVGGSGCEGVTVPVSVGACQEGDDGVGQVTVSRGTSRQQRRGGGALLHVTAGMPASKTPQLGWAWS